MPAAAPIPATLRLSGPPPARARRGVRGRRLLLGRRLLPGAGGAARRPRALVAPLAPSPARPPPALAAWYLDRRLRLGPPGGRAQPGAADGRPACAGYRARFPARDRQPSAGGTGRARGGWRGGRDRRRTRRHRLGRAGALQRPRVAGGAAALLRRAHR